VHLSISQSRPLNVKRLNAAVSLTYSPAAAAALILPYSCSFIHGLLIKRGNFSENYRVHLPCVSREKRSPAATYKEPPYKTEIYEVVRSSVRFFSAICALSPFEITWFTTELGDEPDCHIWLLQGRMEVPVAGGCSLRNASRKCSRSIGNTEGFIKRRATARKYRPRGTYRDILCQKTQK